MPLYKHFLDSESRAAFMEDSGLNKYWKFRKERKPLVKLGMLEDMSFSEYCRQFAPMEKSFWKRFTRFYNISYLPDIMKQEFAEYKNTYGNKVRCSKSLGLYGLKHVRTFNNDVQVVLHTSSQVLTQAPYLRCETDLSMSASALPSVRG